MKFALMLIAAGGLGNVPANGKVWRSEILSGFAAIVRFDGQPVDAEIIHRMTAAMEFRGRDGIRTEALGFAAVGHCAFHTTAESLEAQQPLSSADSGAILAMDGWLANPDELRAELVQCKARLRDGSDAELVLHAYEQWGEDCVQHMEGEYAFVICDMRSRTVFCAKDHGGLVPLHYHWNGRRLLVASDMAAILAADDFVRKLNPDAMAEYLASEFYTIDSTFWSGVMRLPFASAMTAGPQGPVSWRYWTPPLDVCIQHPREEDYFAHYREILLDCVRRASRSQAPLGCEVSGGHDSSALFAMACRLEESQRLLAPTVKGFTMAGEAGGMSDEIDYARDVGRFFGKPIHEAPPFQPDRAWFEQSSLSDRAAPFFPNSASVITEFDVAKQCGCRVLLNGEGGDEFVGGSAYFLNEMIRAGAWGELAAELNYFRQADGWREATRKLFRFGLRPLAPLGFDLAMLQMRGDRAPWGEHLGAGPHWASKSVLDRLAAIRETARMNQANNLKVRDPARRKMWRDLQSPFGEHIRDASARLVARQGIELRTPMYSRRYMDFVFSMPETLRVRRGTKKFIHLQAMHNDLPKSVLDRRNKAEFSFTFDRYLPRMKQLFCEEIPALAPAEISADGLRNLYANYEDRNEGGWELWRIFGWHLLVRQQQEAVGAGY